MECDLDNNGYRIAFLMMNALMYQLFLFFFIFDLSYVDDYMETSVCLKGVNLHERLKFSKDYDGMRLG